MKPIKFKQQNTTFARDQKQYLPLPALKIKSKRGLVISCWEMSWKERLVAMFTGKVYQSQLSFNHPLTPTYLFTLRTEIEDLIKDEKEFDEKI